MPPPARTNDGFVSTPHTVQFTGNPVGGIDPRMLLAPRAGQAVMAAPSAAQAAGNMASRPKDSKSRAPPAKPQFSFTSANDRSESEEADTDRSSAQASMLARMHNLEDRAPRPQKRIKRSESPTRNATWAPAGGGGLVSQHIKDKQRDVAAARAQHGNGGAEAIRREIESSMNIDTQKKKNTVDLTDDTIDLTAPSQPAAVDLTQDAADGEGDFYTINGKKVYYQKDDVNEQEVCYGRIEGARIQCHIVPDTGRQISSRSEWPPMAVELRRGLNKKSLIIKAIDPTKKDFGNLDPRTSLALKPFLDSPAYRIRLEARTDTRAKKPFEAPGQPTSDSIVVHVNIFGPRRYAVDPVGKALSQKQIWLRTPKTLPHGKEFFNPHCNDPEQAKLVKKASMTLKLSNGSSVGFRSRTVEEAQFEVQSLFDTLQKTDKLPLVDADSNVTSTLLKHQKQALAWMLEREKPAEYEPGKDTAGTLWKCRQQNGKLVWHHIVTGHQLNERPPDVLGGLLADMMGLGKTLSILALMSYTRAESLEFERKCPDKSSKSGIALRNLKSTLLVCPVSVITNWEDQIIQHIREDGLKYYVYHGSSRRRDLEFLSQFDVILTSYAVVKSELSTSSRASKSDKASPLSGAMFFRVVLDEAHTIRTQNTQQFLACLQVKASRRWALTATPVQNRLDDLGAIIRFLGVFPFNVNNIFGQFILSPFKNADPEALAHLRVLVDSITLRRLKDTIDLAPRQDETIMLAFNEEEQSLYNFFASDAMGRINAMTTPAQFAGSRPKLSGKGYMNILRSILCLRQICAHGKDMLREEDMRLIEGQSSSTAIDVEEEEARPALDERQAYSTFELLKETNAALCAKCGKGITAVVQDVPDDEDETFCTMLPCYQVVCNECSREVDKLAKAQSSQGKDRMCCPFCDLAWRISLFPITANGMVRAEQRREELAREPKKAKMINRYDNPSSKTVQLIARLRDSEMESVPLVDAGEPPIKSVVFSAWTTHLDLISIALDREGIEYTMLVGSMSRRQRRESLDKFRSDGACNVLLVSIGTGGVGLNLTAASRVFLMDIGFNPMAEQQAVDRVHRLGQRRPVLFTRFLMHNSIEGRILQLQKKKMDLADLSLQKGKLDKTEAARARLEELVSLFR